MKFAKSCTSRLYLPREKYGYGLKTLENSAQIAITYTYAYLSLNEDMGNIYQYCMKLDAKAKRTIISDFRNIVLKNIEGLEVTRVADGSEVYLKVNENIYQETKTAARAISEILKKAHETRAMIEFQSKRQASLFSKLPDIDHENSTLWLKDGWINSKTVRNIAALHENSLWTNSHPGNNKKSNECRLCGIDNETPQHIASACPTNRPTLMLDRHNSVVRVIYECITKHLGWKPPHYTERIPNVIEREHIKLLSDEVIPTIGVIKCNRPDLCIFDTNKKVITIIEVTVAWRTRLRFMEKWKYDKYAINSTLTEPDLSIRPGPSLAGELQRLHKMTVNVIPIAFGACGELSTNTEKNLLKIPGITRENIRAVIIKCQKGTVLGTDRVLRAHLSIQ
jgi:hypothetical protein